MTLTQALIAFLIAGGLLTITPGVDTLMVLRTATVEGPRRAAAAALGIAAGCLVWGLAVALGIGAMIAAAPLAFTLVRWAGAAYLGWIGLSLVLRPREALSAEHVAQHKVNRSGALSWMQRGFVTNILNPKVGIFYIAFLPQFVPAGYGTASFIVLLACLHVLMGLLWFALLIAATRPLGRALAHPSLLRRMDRVTGCLFVALGIKLAVTR